MRVWTPLTSFKRSSFLISWPLTRATTVGSLAGSTGLTAVAGAAPGVPGAAVPGAAGVPGATGAGVVWPAAGLAGAAAAALSPWVLGVALSLAREQPAPATRRTRQERESGRSCGRDAALCRFMVDSLRGGGEESS